jgi:hypothetical protein
MVILVSGVISLIFCLVLLVIAGLELRSAYANNNWMMQEEIQLCFGLGLGGMLPAICQIYGGNSMRLRRSWKWSWTAAVVSIVNLNPAWLIGMPAGVYALAVLIQRTDGVKSNADLFAKSKSMRAKSGRD